jgi:hypothetical protein
MKIDLDKLEDVSRNIGVVFTSSGILGFLLNYSLLDSFIAIFFGILCIIFGIKER